MSFFNIKAGFRQLCTVIYLYLLVISISTKQEHELWKSPAASLYLGNILSATIRHPTGRNTKNHKTTGLEPHMAMVVGLHLVKHLGIVLLLQLAGDIEVNPGPNQPGRTANANCLVINARSLKSWHKINGKSVCNLSRFQELVYSENADIVWTTETWLNNYIENTEILPADYTIYRKDRESRAGGVLLAVKSSSFISSKEIPSLESDLEVINIEIITKSNVKLLACCNYRPPDTDRTWLDKFNIYLAQLSSSYDNVLICGDYNFPKVDWISQEGTTGADEVMFTELLNDYYQTQLNTKASRGENVLDLVITSVPDLVKNISTLEPIQSGIITDHSTIVFQLSTSIRAAPRLGRTVYDYRRGSFDGLRSALKATNLCNIIQSDDINHNWLRWRDTFLAIVKDFIPTKKIKGRNSPPWINGEIIYTIRKKEAIRQKLKRSPTNYLRNRFKELRTKVKTMVSESRAHFFNSLDLEFKLHPKRFWSIFKLKNKASRVPERMSLGCSSSSCTDAVIRSATTPSEIAELFNDHFSSVFSRSGQAEPSSTQPISVSVPTLTDVHLMPDEVCRAIQTLNINKATGPDGIPVLLLKETAQQIAPSLTLLYNQSLSSGILPDAWKMANVVPVFKKGEKEHVENYRPISLLPIVSKILERCVLNNVRDHLQGFISHAQHGFIPGKSCTTQLVEVLDYIGSQLDLGKQTDIIYLDMSKAFDKVNHTALINKLRCFNISGKLIDWFQCYLRDRRQRVTVLGNTSPEKPVTSGVPQGSILGPMLFLLYVNDLPDGIKHSKVSSFADDTKIFKRIDSVVDAAYLQSDLCNLDNWSAASGLIFNKTKCKCQRITRKKKPIEYPYNIKDNVLIATTAEKDLGVLVTCDLTWLKHTIEHCAKANKLLGFLRRCATEIKNLKTRRTLYLTVVRPALGYATQVWSPQSVDLIKRCERIQRRATKFIMKVPFACVESYKDRLIVTKLLPLSYWHEYLDLNLFFKAISGLVTISSDVLPAPAASSRLTRSTSNPDVYVFATRKCRTVTFQRSFFNRTTRIWNTLPENIRNKTNTQRKFKTLLLEHYERALRSVYDVDDPRTWKTICLKCNTARSLKNTFTCCQ